MNRPRFLMLFMMMASCCIADAQPFMKKYSRPNGPEVMIDLLRTSEGFAYISDRQFKLLDQQGNVIKEWEPVGRPAALLQKVIRVTTGKYYVIAAKSGMALPGSYLFILSASGDLEQEIDIESAVTKYSVDLFAGRDGKLFVTYLKEMEGKPARLCVHHLSAAGVEIWKRELAEGVYGGYSLLTAPDGGLEIALVEPTDVFKLKVVQFTEQGIKSEKVIKEIWFEGEVGLGTFACKTPDGGYLFACSEYPYDENGEVILLKADAAGAVQWTKPVDVKLDDILLGLQRDANGYYLLTISGKTQNWSDEDWEKSNGDMALISLQPDGNIRWRKAFGSSGIDESPTKLIVTENEILIGGFTSVIPDIHHSSFLIKTGRDGNLQDHPFPHTIQPAAALQPIDFSFPTRTKQLVSTVQMADGGYIASAKVMGAWDRDYVACIFRTNAQGQVQWVKFPSDNLSQPGQIRKTLDGNYIMLLTEFSIGSLVSAVKFSPNGDVIWSKLVWSIHIDDIVAVPDGGYLLTGAKYDNMIQNNALLMKLDANGEEEWVREFQYPERTLRGKHIRLTPDQKVVIAGTSKHFTRPQEEIYFLMTDLIGQPIRAQVFGKPDSNFTVQCVLPAEDNHMLLGGYATALNGSNKDLLLMKINRGGFFVWKKTYDINLQDESTQLIALGDTAYCLAGTTNDPVFGTRKQIGFLANIKLDGTNNAIRYFGNREGTLHISNVYQAANNKLFFTANKEDEYGSAEPVIGSFDPGVILSTGDPELNRSVQLFPNPAKEFAKCSIDNQFSGNVRISITDIKGSCLKQIDWRKSTGLVTIPLSLHGLASGVYQVNISMGKARVMKRLVVIP